MKDRAEEFMNYMGNGKSEHELDLELDDDKFLEKVKDETETDLDWEEQPVITRYKDAHNRNKKGGTK